MDIVFGSFLVERRTQEDLRQPELKAQEIERIRYGLFTDGWAVFVCPNTSFYEEFVDSIKDDLDHWSEDYCGGKYKTSMITNELERKLVVINTKMVRVQQLEPLVVYDVVFAA